MKIASQVSEGTLVGWAAVQMSERPINIAVPRVTSNYSVEVGKAYHGRDRFRMQFVQNTFPRGLGGGSAMLRWHH